MIIPDWLKIQEEKGVKQMLLQVLIGIAGGYFIFLLLNTFFTGMDTVGGSFWSHLEWVFNNHPDELFMPGWFGAICMAIGAICGWFWDWIQDYFYD